LRIAIEVFRQERFLGRYITRNMDAEGIFIEMRSTDLEANDVVKLVFVFPDREGCDCTLMAGVVRVDADGVGMMLIDHEHKAPDILRAADLSNRVQGRRVQATPASANTGEYGYGIKYRA
jgi:hypothetical protein